MASAQVKCFTLSQMMGNFYLKVWIKPLVVPVNGASSDLIRSNEPHVGGSEEYPRDSTKPTSYISAHHSKSLDSKHTLTKLHLSDAQM